jgi:hypothetical protein
VHLFNAADVRCGCSASSSWLLAGVLRGSRLPHRRQGRRCGRADVPIALRRATPWRVAEIVENPSIIFFRSISTSLTMSIVAVLMAFPVTTTSPSAAASRVHVARDRDRAFTPATCCVLAFR